MVFTCNNNKIWGASEVFPKCHSAPCDNNYVLLFFSIEILLWLFPLLLSPPSLQSLYSSEWIRISKKLQAIKWKKDT